MLKPLSVLSTNFSVERTIENIHTRMESGAWSSGMLLPKEQDLAAILDTAPNTVRDAIRILSRAEVLSVRHKEWIVGSSRLPPGETARRLHVMRLRDHLDLRKFLESEAARCAARNRTPADIDTLHRLLLDRGYACQHDELEDFIACDLAFHEAIARISGNEGLSELYSHFTLTIDTNMQSVISENECLDPGQECHHELLTAIELGEPDAAANAAAGIFANLRGRLSVSIRRRPQVRPPEHSASWVSSSTAAIAPAC